MDGSGFSFNIVGLCVSGSGDMISFWKGVKGKGEAIIFHCIKATSVSFIYFGTRFSFRWSRWALGHWHQRKQRAWLFLFTLQNSQNCFCAYGYITCYFYFQISSWHFLNDFFRVEPRALLAHLSLSKNIHLWFQRYPFWGYSAAHTYWGGLKAALDSAELNSKPRCIESHC